MENRILHVLRSTPEQWVSGERLGAEEGISRVAISKRIRKLQSLGYQIESSTRKGYRLKSEPSGLIAEDLKLHLEGSGLYRHPFVIKPETGSTNDDLRELAVQGAPEGTVVLAERQAHGRGRRGRSWEARPGESLLFSILLRPPIPPGQGTLIPLLAAAAVYRALNRLGADGVEIKWPNDVLIHGKKVCGILCEMSVSLEGIDYAMLGLGVNVTTPPLGFPEEIRETACSLFSSFGGIWNRTRVLTAILKEVEPLVATLWQGDGGMILEAWNEGAPPPGQHITVTLSDGSAVPGTVLGITGEGALRVQDAEGQVRIFHSGEVSLRDGPGSRNGR